MVERRGDEALVEGSRCVLAAFGERGPVVSPMAFWFDGAALWMSTPADSVKVRALRRRPDCAVYVPPAEDQDGAPGAVATGTARIFSLADPRGLAFHGAVVSAAMAALAARNAGSVLGYVRNATRIPARFLPQQRVALRVTLSRLRGARPPEVGRGIAPALPTAVPADVRRLLAGRRRVVVAAQEADRLVVAPAVWGAGFALVTPPTLPLPVGVPGAVVVDVDDDGPTDVAGLALRGLLEAGRLVPERVTWWRGFEVETVPVTGAAPAPGAGRRVGSVVLPE